MSDNAVKRLNAFGQGPWLDFISRDPVRDATYRAIEEKRRVAPAAGPAP